MEASTRVLTCCLAALCLSPSLATGSPGEEPGLVWDEETVLFSREHGWVEYPVFVHAELVFDQHGRVASGLFPEATVGRIEAAIAAAEMQQGCVWFGTVTDLYEPRSVEQNATLEGALSAAKTVLVARVAGRSFGWGSGNPGQLLTLEPEAVLKGSASRREYKIFLPVGTFEAGPYRICKTQVGVDYVPEVGEMVLVTVPGGSANQVDDEFIRIVPGSLRSFHEVSSEVVSWQDSQ